MQVEEIFIWGKKRKKNRRISLLDDYYYQSPNSVANQNAGFALVHQLDGTNFIANSSQHSYQRFDMQTRRKGQFCIVLILQPRLCVALNKEIFDRLNSYNSYWDKVHRISILDKAVTRVFVSKHIVASSYWLYHLDFVSFFCKRLVLQSFYVQIH